MRRPIRPTSMWQRKQKQRKEESSAAKGILLVIVFYIVIASLVYRFKHSEQTETELFINLPDAMMWR